MACVDTCIECYVKEKCDCTERICYPISERDILYTIAAINKGIDADTKNFIQFLSYDYSCKLLSQADIDRLMAYKDTLHNYLSKLKSDTVDFCSNNLHQIKSRVQKILGYYSAELYIEYDGSGKNEWFKNNPFSVSYESWERSLYKVCTLPKLEIRNVPKRVKMFSYEVRSTPVECDLVYSVYSSMVKCPKFNGDVRTEIIDCKVDVDASSKEIDCDVDIDARSNALDCNANVDVRNELMSCGIDPDVCNELINCGYDFSVSTEEETCIEITKEYKKIKIIGNGQ